MNYSLTGLTGLEPVTTGLTDRGSTIELQTNKLFHYVDFSQVALSVVTFLFFHAWPPHRLHDVRAPATHTVSSNHHTCLLFGVRSEN
jgi:hypothetical protein